MSSTPPEWIPADTREHATMVGERHVRVNAQSLGSIVHFGDVPAGWIIEIGRPGDAIPQTLAVNSVGTGLRWHLDSPGPHRIQLSPEMRRVELGRPKPYRGRRKAHLGIEAGSHRLYFESGQYQVQAVHSEDRPRPNPPSFEAYVSPTSGADQLVLHGNAVVRKLAGEGDVTVKCPVRAVRIDLQGHLEIDGPLMGSTVAVEGDLRAGRLEAQEVSGHSIVLGSDEPSGPPAVSKVRVLRAENLTVTGTVAGNKDHPVDLHVSQSATLGGARHVVFHGQAIEEDSRTDEVVADQDSDQSLPTFEIKGECSDLRSVGWFGDCALEEVTGPVSILRVHRLTAGRVSGTRVSLTAREEVKAKEVSASGELSAPLLWIERQAVAEGGELVLTASREVRIGHTARRLTLRCCDDSGEATVTIGDAGWPSVSFAKPAVSRQEVTRSSAQFRQARRGAPKHDPVEGCVILSSGDIRIQTGLLSSIIRTKGGLEVTGPVDLTSLSPTDVRIASDVSETDDWIAEAHEKPFEADRIWIDDELRLSSEQTVNFGSSFSCATIQGGRIRSKAAESLIAVDSTQHARLKAATIGVTAEVASTTLQSWGLVHLQGTVDENSRVAISGDGEFKGVVEAKIRWTAELGRVFRALERLRSLRIQAGNQPKQHVEGEERPRLSGGPDFKVDRLSVGRSTRLAVELDRTGSGAKRGQNETRALCESFHLSEAAEVDFEAGMIDLGAVELAGNARLTQLASSKTLLSLSLCSVAGSHLVRIASKGTVRIVRGAEEQLSLFEERGETPSLWIEQGRCEVLAPLDEVGFGDPETMESTVERARDVVPTLVVDGAGRIGQLAGWFHLAGLEGRIQGADRDPDPKLGKLYKKLPRPGKLLKSSLEKVSEDHRSGHLVGIDVSTLPFEDISSMRRVHWFEPDGATLKKYATRRLDEARARDRAQKLRSLAEVAQATAAPGASRAAVMWAAARAHHAVVHTWPEWLARWVLWLVGYGWRPRPSLLTLAAWTLLLTGGLIAFDSKPDCAAPPSDFIQGPYGFGQQLVRVLSLPAGLLRLDPGGATTYAPVGCSTGWHLVAFGITGFFLGSTLLAIRNYLRTPVDR